MLIYRIAPGLGLRWLDDALAVYQPERRQTHLLDGPAGELIDLLKAWPAGSPEGAGVDVRAIARALLGTTVPAADDAEELASVTAQLAPMLDTLTRLGLLVATPC